MTTPTLRRLRDFPEVRDLELAAVIDPRLGTRDERFHNDRLDAVARALFGVTAVEVSQWAFSPLDDLDDRVEDGQEVTEAEADAAVAEYERRQEILLEDWEDGRDTLSQGARLGWDLRNEYGQALLVADNLFPVLLAAVRGAAGARLPAEGVETLAAWEANLRVEVRPPRRTSAPTPPLTEAERKRRDQEARSSTVWRPSPRRA